jgi:heme/copper-type cytochrome/quinol oxidase subunit 3
MTTATATWRPRTIPNAYWALAFVLITEVMFFGGLVSALLVSRGTAVAWPPPGQPRLSPERTILNTMVLLLSVWPVALALRERSIKRAAPWVAATLAAGAAFVTLQGVEWIRLVRFGLTATSSLYGGFFYLIVGAHALHVLAGLAILGLAQLRQWSEDARTAAGLFWLFVVALWPVLYWLVYLS